MTVVAATSIDGLLRAHLNSIVGDLVAPIEAQKFVASMRERDPDGLAEWLDRRAEVVVCEVIGTLLRSQRSVAQRRQGARAFADAGTDVKGMLDVRYVISGAGRLLRDMTRNDLDLVAADYDAQSIAARFEAAFLRAIKKRLPDAVSTVGDVLTEADIAALRSTKAH